MAHDFTVASCTIYIWNPIGFARGLWGGKKETQGTRVGHSAIRIGDGVENIYLSFWPDEAPKSTGINSYVRGYMQNSHTLLPFDQTKVWAQGQNLTFDENTDKEGTKPDQKFRFTAGLDWAAMIAKAKQIRGEVCTYNFLKKNCTHAVANVLHAGNPPLDVPLTGWITNTWQPYDLTNYCRELAKRINEAVPGAGLARIGGGAWV